MLKPHPQCQRDGSNGAGSNPLHCLLLPGGCQADRPAAPPPCVHQVHQRRAGRAQVAAAAGHVESDSAAGGQRCRAWRGTLLLALPGDDHRESTVCCQQLCKHSCPALNTAARPSLTSAPRPTDGPHPRCATWWARPSTPCSGAQTSSWTRTATARTPTGVWKRGLQAAGVGAHGARQGCKNNAMMHQGSHRAPLHPQDRGITRARLSFPA